MSMNPRVDGISKSGRGSTFVLGHPDWDSSRMISCPEGRQAGAQQELLPPPQTPRRRKVSVKSQWALDIYRSTFLTTGIL